MSIVSHCEPRNRRLTDIVAAGDAALCLAGVEPLARLPLLERREYGFASKFHPFRLPVGAGTCGSLGDAAAFQLRGHAEHGA
jgi:hypothetical protein